MDFYIWPEVDLFKRKMCGNIIFLWMFRHVKINKVSAHSKLFGKCYYGIGDPGKFRIKIV